ncbi:MAG: DUF386 domain-containing protein [Clostridia bacterium]|nr:DUF386 domain-containing protein [Clostridia bacterium]
MIYDTLAHLAQYEGIHCGVMRGLRFLAETDFSTLADGRYELDGDNVFANVMSYTTRERNDTPESHQEYIDIQYVISGEELIAVAPLEDMSGVAEAHPERDIWLNIGCAEPLTLGHGRFIAVWPGDAHAPGIAPGGVPAPARKCVVKVRVEPK